MEGRSPEFDGGSQTLEVLLNDWFDMDSKSGEVDWDEGGCDFEISFRTNRGVEICSLTGLRVCVGMALIIRTLL